MNVAKRVFYIAGVWGVLIIAPLFFLRRAVETQAPATVLTHPEFYYGFACAVLMWQISFFIIARNPVRYRAMIIPPVLVKFGYAAIVLILYRNGEPIGGQLPFAAVDILLAILFLVAFFKTRARVATEDLLRD